MTSLVLGSEVSGCVFRGVEALGFRVKGFGLSARVFRVEGLRV